MVSSYKHSESISSLFLASSNRALDANTLAVLVDGRYDIFLAHAGQLDLDDVLTVFLAYIRAWANRAVMVEWEPAPVVEEAVLVLMVAEGARAVITTMMATATAEAVKRAAERA